MRAYSSRLASRLLTRSAPFAALALLAAACGLTFEGLDTPAALPDATADAPVPADASRDTATADATPADA
ncbi:MAG TPA: hypothetical protein PK141_17205, partial [Polyangiaceae bacterium]|nr:hypothetical protein [Polyangiaceae bacterium]